MSETSPQNLAWWPFPLFGFNALLLLLFGLLLAGIGAAILLFLFLVIL